MCVLFNYICVRKDIKLIMIFNSLKQTSTKRFYNKTIQQQKEQKTQQQQKIETIGIVVHEKDLNRINQEELFLNLGAQNGNAKLLVYKDQMEKDEDSPRFFTATDFGWHGSLKSNNLQDFVKNEFDLLINYTTELNLYTNMVTLLSAARFKIGFATIDDRLFDLIVSEPSFNIAVFHEEIRKYLMILKKI